MAERKKRSPEVSQGAAGRQAPRSPKAKAAPRPTSAPNEPKREPEAVSKTPLDSPPHTVSAPRDLAPTSEQGHDAAAAIAPADALQVVSFTLAGEEYGFPIMRVQEVLRARFVHITPIPNAPSFMEGVMNLRGRVIPVVGLRRRFGMPELPVDRGGRVIVVEVSGRTIGVTVDSVVEVVTVDGSAIEPLPDLVATPHSEFIVGVSRIAERIVIVLDMDRVFSTEERVAMEQMASASREEASCA